MQWQVLRRWPEEIDNPGGVRGERAPVTRCLQRPGSILFLPSQVRRSMHQGCLLKPRNFVFYPFFTHFRPFSPIFIV